MPQQIEDLRDPLYYALLCVGLCDIESFTRDNPLVELAQIKWGLDSELERLVDGYSL